MPCPERGFALVTVLFLLALLMVMAVVLSDKVLRASRGASLAGARDQARQAAGAGIEQARHLLAVNYRNSSGWVTYLAGGSGGERYPATPALSIDIGGATVDIFLRDNPDGDADPLHDNDLQLFVLARARAGHGPEVMVESLCAFEPLAAGYGQGGESVRPSGQAKLDEPAEPWTAPVAAFHLRD